MKRYSVSALFYLFGFSACLQVAPTNPYDDDTPSAQQADVTFLGRVALAQSPMTTENDARDVVVSIEGGISARTAPSGSFSLSTNAGAYVIVAQKEGYRSVRTPVLDAKIGQTIDIGTLTLFDATTPGAVILERPKAVVSSAALQLAFRERATDPSDNLDSYAYRTNAGPWTRITSETSTMSVALLKNANNRIVIHAVDAMGNIGPDDVIEVTHDDIAPDAPKLEAKPSSQRVDLTWTTTATDIDRFRVEYGDGGNFLDGIWADQGPSPLTVYENSMRLSGLIDGHQIFVRVTAIDTAGHETPSELIDVTPGPVTPVRLGSVTLPSPAINSVTDDRYVWVLGEDNRVHVVDQKDLSQPELIVSFDVGAPATDLKLISRHLVLSVASGLRVFDVTNPAVPGTGVAHDLSVGGCATATSTVVGLDSQNMTIFAAVQSDQDNCGGLWRVDLSDPAAPVDIGFSTLISPQDQVDLSSRLTGPVRVSGRYTAIGFNQKVPNQIDTVPADFESGRGVLIIDVQTSTVPRTELVPLFNSKYQEVFSGTGVAGLPERGYFDLAGPYLYAAYDGFAVLYDFQTLNNGGTWVTQGTTLNATLGTVSLGLQTARSIASAGGIMAVSHYQRSANLEPIERVDFIELSNRQNAAGAGNGVPNPLQSLGGLSISAKGRMHWRGSNLTVTGNSELVNIEVAAPLGPSPIAAVGENPTGINVGMGNYIVHQRALRGVGVWDVSNPSNPILQNGGTCVPGCFLKPDLAGNPIIDGGLMFVGLTGSGDLDANDTTVMAVDVASDVTSLSNRMTAHNKGLPNPCVGGRAAGFVKVGRIAYLGCRDEAKIFGVDLADLDNTLTTTNTGATLDSPVRWMDATRMKDRAGNVRYVLLAVKQNGQIAAFDITDAHTSVPSALTPLDLDLPPTNMSFAFRIEAELGRIYVLGGRATVQNCDPSPTEDCGIQANALSRIDLDTMELQEMRTTMVGEPKQTLSVFHDTVILGRSTQGNPYEFWGLGGAADFKSLAAPNPLAVDAIIHGLQMYTSSFVIYDLE